jgi:hypothetical protein
MKGFAVVPGTTVGNSHSTRLVVFTALINLMETRDSEVKESPMFDKKIQFADGNDFSSHLNRVGEIDFPFLSSLCDSFSLLER